MTDVVPEQVAYYRARASAYDAEIARMGGYPGTVPDPDLRELDLRRNAYFSAMKDALRTRGPVHSALELACGSGNWTAEIARLAGEVTALDAAPEMLAFARTLGFRFRAHRVGHPDRKGRIERPFAYIENNFLAARDFEDFDDLNRQAVTWCREGKGPYILEMLTYRYRGHSMSDPAKYRTREEVQKMRTEHDPIEQVRARILEEKIGSEDDLKKMDAEVRDIVNEAAEFATNDPEPDPAELWTDVYR